MSRPPDAARLVRRVRRRLHAAAVSAVARRAAWVAAAVGLAAGVLHLTLGVPPAGVTLATTLVVLGVPVAVTLARRPSLEDAALRADAWLGTRSLYTAALDQLRRPAAARAGAAAVVIAQADAAAPAAGLRLVTSAPRLGLGRLYAPLAVGLAGAFLHLAPVRTADPSRAGGAVRMPAVPAMGELVPTPETRAAEVRARAPGGMPASGERAERTSDAGETGSARGGGAGGAGGGTAPGSGAATARGAPAAAGVLPEIVWIDLPRGDGSAGGSAVALDAGGAPGAGAVAAAPPVPRPSGVAARDDLAPATRAYAAAYLRHVEERP